MLVALSQRILPALQLTRMALVFTAIADSACGYLLLRAARNRDYRNGLDLDVRLMVALGIVSIGLYGYGMSLNDIIDRRRDAQTAAHRPLPSGRIRVLTAHAICILMGLSALLGGLYFVHANIDHGWVTFAMVVWTGLLITFYDAVGKYLVGPGLVTLGLVRFFHSVIAAPELPVLWHPLLLLNHIAIVSTLAYHWEQKRPPLTRNHILGVVGILALLDLVSIGLCFRYRLDSLWLTDGLMLPASAVLVFATIAVLILRRTHNSRQAGQSLMLAGLLWLIVYDAAFATAYVHWMAGAALLGLLPLAYLSVRMIRWWSQLILASQRPEFQRAGLGGKQRK